MGIGGTKVNLNADTICERIKAIGDNIKRLEEDLPYADHGDYGQLKARISSLHSERVRLVKQIGEQK